MASRQGSKNFTAAPTSTATQVLAANLNRIQALIANNGTSMVFLGKDGTVTTTSGVSLNAGQALWDDSTTDAWYGILPSGTGDVRVLEIS